MRTRICYWILILVPLLVYVPNVVTEYAMREDYSFLREARDEPGKIVRSIASQGRPLYGALLETSYEHVQTVDQLFWLRVASVGFLIGAGLLLWRTLDAAGWPVIDAAALGLGITLLPSAQIIASWAVGWPWALSLLLALAGFSAVEMEVEKGGLKRMVGGLGGAFIYVLCALINPTNTLFAVVPLAALILTKERRSTRELLQWIGLHVTVLLGGLLIYYILLKLFFIAGIFHESARLQVETNPFTKLLWFLWQPLANALALLPLRDDHHTGEYIFWPAALGVLALLWWVVRDAKIRSDPKARLAWVLCLAALPWLAALTTLLAAERTHGYRGLSALSGLVLTVIVVALRRTPLPAPRDTYVRYGGLGALLLLAAVLAAHNTHSLVAQPLGREWSLMHDALDRVRLKEVNRVFVIPATEDDRSTARIFDNEFGAVASSVDWAPREMFDAGLRARFPDGLPPQFSISYSQGHQPPAPGTYDILIDLRKLNRWRE